MSSASASFAQCKGFNPFWKAFHNGMTVNGAKPKPAPNFHARAPAADAKSGIRVDNAYLDAGRFDLRQIKGVHALKIGKLLVIGHSNAP